MTPNPNPNIDGVGPASTGPPTTGDGNDAPDASATTTTSMADPSPRTDPLGVLGADVFHEVLMRLEVRDLLRAECVSRTWRAFSFSDPWLWRTMGKPLGVHLPEWERTEVERRERREMERRERERRLEEEQEEEEENEGTDGERSEHAAESGSSMATKTQEVIRRAVAMETERLDTDVGPAAPYRDALLGHLQLRSAWKRRQVYETLMPTPAFKLRSITIDPDEDTIYALAETALEHEDENADQQAGDSEDSDSSDGSDEFDDDDGADSSIFSNSDTPFGMSRTDSLLVLNRYTGEHLLTVPWIVKTATISAGAGYVVVASVPGVDHEEEADWGTVPDPQGPLHIYRTANAAKRAESITKDDAEPREFHHERGLPLEFFTTITALAECRAFRVKLDTRSRPPQALLAGVNEEKIVLCFLDDDLRIEEFPVERLRVVDSCTPSEEDLEERGRALDINFDDEYIYVVTHFQCHVFDRNTRSKVIAFPDPRASKSQMAALVLYVPYNFPFGLENKKEWTAIPQPFNGINLHLSATSESFIDAYRADTEQENFNDVINPSWAQHRLDDDYRSVIVSDNDLILRREYGSVIVVRNHRSVLAEAAALPLEKRAEFIGSRTAVLSYDGPIEVTQVWGNRLVCHEASQTIFCFDLDQIPPLPFMHLDPLTKVTAYALDISCLQELQVRSSIAVDARGIYLADWDKGTPCPDIDYEDLHRCHVDDEEWPTPIRPNWGCIKVWTARPESTLLTYPCARRLAEYNNRPFTLTILPNVVVPHDPFEDETLAPDLTALFDGPLAPDSGTDSETDNGTESGESDEGMDSGVEQALDLLHTSFTNYDTDHSDHSELDAHEDDDMYQSLFNPNYMEQISREVSEASGGPASHSAAPADASL